MENTKLTWEEITSRYYQEWVLLDDYDWPEGEEYPTAGVVKVHARTREEFDTLIAAREAGFDSALIFVGIPEKFDDTVTTRGCSRVEYSAS